MLFQNASAEIALLLFTLLVPVGLMALAAMACIRGFFPAADEAAARKADRLTTLPAVVMLVGLVCSFFHLGSAGHVFSMLSGVGTSPLSNEIAVAAVAIAVGAVYWIICLVKPLAAGAQKGFGIALLILALVCTVFTGLAYAIPTIPTWDSPFSCVAQLGLALLGGPALAAASFAIAGYKLDQKAALMLKACGAVGLALVAVDLVGQAGVSAAAVSSSGAMLGATMGDYTMVATACIILCGGGYALWACSKGNRALVCVGMVCLLVGLALMRVDFYGTFLSAGLAYL